MPTPTIAEVIRDYVTNGVPSSGAHKPRKADWRAWGTWVEQLLAALAADAGGITELPELIYYFTVTGGTANAIVATPNATPPTAPGAALLTMTATAVNTGSVTLNGKPLRANGGEELQAGEIHGGDLLSFLDLGAEYRLITDPGSLRNKLAAMEWASNAEDDPVSIEAGGDGATSFSAKHWAAKSNEDADRSKEEADRSEDARDIAAGYASDAVSQGNVPIYATVIGMAALEIPAGINAVRVNGYGAVGDGRGGLFVDQDNGMQSAFNSGGTTARPWYPALSAFPTLLSLGADPTGGTDVSAVLDAAEALGGTIVVGPGTYLVDTDRAWDHTKATFHFRGGSFINAPGRTQTGTMKVVAGTHDFILGGEIVRGSYIRTGNIPYDFGWDLTVFGSVPTPEWFGAVGDGIADDQAAWHAAIHSCGTVLGNGSSVYATSVHLVLRESSKCFSMEDGCEVKALNANLGQVLGIRGQPPVSASAEPSEWNVSSALLNITVDGADATNNNGVGISWCRGARVSIKRAKNIGRKAFTGQYWVQDCKVNIIEVEDASTELGSTHGVLTLEGQGSGINFSLDGGVSSTADMQGADVTGNIIDVSGVRYSGYNYIVVQRSTGNIIRAAKLGDALGAGRHVFLGAYAKGNHIEVVKAGNTERSFVATDALSMDNIVLINGGDAVGTGTDGYSVNDAGTRNDITAKVDHSNTSTTAGRAFNLNGSAGIIRAHVRSCDSSTVFGGTGTGYLLPAENKVVAAASRIALSGGIDWRFIGGDYDPGTATGIQIGANGCLVMGVTIRGDGPNRVLVDSGVTRWRVVDNQLPGVNPEVSVTTAADMWAGGAKFNNDGDVAGYQCLRMGLCIIAFGLGPPEGSVAAAVGSEYTDIHTGIKYSKTSGSGNTGWVVTGTQA